MLDQRGIFGILEAILCECVKIRGP